MRSYFPLFRLEQFRDWHSLALSMGLHLVALAVLPALLANLSVAKPTDKKPTAVHFVDVPPRHRELPKVEPEPALQEPVKQEAVARLAPQTASAALEPMRNVAPVTVARVKPISDIGMVSANLPARMVTGFSGKVEMPVDRFRPRAQGGFSESIPSAVTSRFATAAVRVSEPLEVKPRVPAEMVAHLENTTGIEDAFAALVRERIAVAKMYPPAARQAGQEGKVLVAFALSKDGQILNLAVDRSSGHERLDQAAVQAVKSASPYPPIPEQLQRNFLSFKLPISFSLR